MRSSGRGRANRARRGPCSTAALSRRGRLALDAPCANGVDRMLADAERGVATRADERVADERRVCSSGFAARWRTRRLGTPRWRTRWRSAGRSAHRRLRASRSQSGRCSPQAVRPGEGRGVRPRGENLIIERGWRATRESDRLRGDARSGPARATGRAPARPSIGLDTSVSRLRCTRFPSSPQVRLEFARASLVLGERPASRTWWPRSTDPHEGPPLGAPRARRLTRAAARERAFVDDGWASTPTATELRLLPFLAPPPLPEIAGPAACLAQHGEDPATGSTGSSAYRRERDRARRHARTDGPAQPRPAAAAAGWRRLAGAAAAGLRTT